MMMKKAGRGRIWTEAARVLAASTQHADCGLRTAVVTFSTCSAVLQPPSRLLCPEEPRYAFLHGRPGVRHPTNSRLRLSAVRLHPASASAPAPGERRKRKGPTRPASRSQAAEGERAVDGPEPGTPTLPWQLPSREDTTTVGLCSRHARPMAPSCSPDPALEMPRPTDQQRFHGILSNSEARGARFVPATDCHVSIL